MAAKKKTESKRGSTGKSSKAAAAKKKASPKKPAAAKKPAAKVKAKARPAPARRSAAKPKTLASRKKAPLKAKPKRPAAKPKVAKKKAVVAPPPVVNPEGLKVARAIVAAALDKKASDVVIIDTTGEAQRVGYDYIVLATGDSDRQLEAISDAVHEALKQTGLKPASTETSPDWVLVDYSDVVAHFFTPDARSVYDFEGRWASAPRPALQG